MYPDRGPSASNAIVMAVVLLAACSGERSSPPAPTTTAEPATATAPQAPAPTAPVSVTVASVQVREVERRVETTGRLLAWQEVVLTTTVSGMLARLHVDLGDRVEAGQALAEFDQHEFTVAIRRAKAALQAAREGLIRAEAQAEASHASLQHVRQGRVLWEANLTRWKAAVDEAQHNLERSRRLVDAQLVAQRELDTAQTQHEMALAHYRAAQVEMQQHPNKVRMAEAQLRSDLSAVRVAASAIQRVDAELNAAEKQLGDAVLRAPIHGAIAHRHADVGERLETGAPAFTIVQADVLRYTGTVPESAALDLVPGQVLQLQIDTAPRRTFDGRITRVSPVVDVANRTVALEAEVPNPQLLLKPGLLARGVARTRGDSGVTFVPASAVSSVAGTARVFVVADGRARARSVRLGARQGDLVEVTDGVQAGERVATSSLAHLHDGAPVTVAAPRSE